MDQKAIIMIVDCLKLLQGTIFWREGETQEEFWDVESDKKFEVEQPEAKKQKTAEE